MQLIVSPEPILYPYLTRPHILVTMSQEAYRRFAPKLRPGGTLIYEEELVRPTDVVREACPAGETRVEMHSVPAMRLAEELGRKMVLNVVLVGFFTAVTGLLRAEAARKAVAELVPKGTDTLNLAAFEKGYACGLAKAPSGVPADSLLTRA